MAPRETRSARNLSRGVVLVGLVAVLCAGYLAVARWRNLPPYEARLIGAVMDKQVMTYQGRRTRVEYFVVLETSRGSQKVAVPPTIYQVVKRGWNVSVEPGRVVATSPSGDQVVAAHAAW